MSEEAKISVLMPMKNASAFLKECLESILSQNTTNWELIVVDDHSTDDSVRIVQRYAKSDNRIRLIQNKGQGIIPALQTAFSESVGGFIHRMDADDIMPEEKLFQLKRLLSNKEKGIVATGNVKYFSEDGVSGGYLKYEQWLNGLCDTNTHWKEIYKECVIASPCWMLRREDFELCGAFNSSIYPEDYDLVFRFYKAGFKVLSSDKVLHLWRDHPQRSSRTHEHYQQNSFFEIKLHYFLEMNYRKDRPLVLWGAGKKGKIMVKLLQSKNIAFKWISNNPNKHGKEIHDQLLYSYEDILSHHQSQIIVTVAQRNAKEEIIKFLNFKGLQEGKQVWFFS